MSLVRCAANSAQRNRHTKNGKIYTVALNHSVLILGGRGPNDRLLALYSPEASAYSISAVILAVFSSMAETEQYFSFDRRTASSMAFRATLPPTR